MNTHPIRMGCVLYIVFCDSQLLFNLLHNLLASRLRLLPGLITRSVHAVIKRIGGCDRAACYGLAGHGRFVEAGKKFDCAAHIRPANGGAFIAFPAVQQGGELCGVAGWNVGRQRLPGCVERITVGCAVERCKAPIVIIVTVEMS